MKPSKQPIQEQIAAALGPGWDVAVVCRVRDEDMAGLVPCYHAYYDRPEGRDDPFFDPDGERFSPEEAYCALLKYALKHGRFTHDEFHRLSAITVPEEDGKP